MKITTKLIALTLNCLCFLTLLTLLCMPLLAQPLQAATATDTISPAPDAVTGIITALVQKAPWVTAILTVIGVLRLILKPLFSFLHSVVKATPTEKDDQLLAKVEGSTALKWVTYGLDWLCSIKVVNPNAGK
jgi:hypothetical protein